MGQQCGELAQALITFANTFNSSPTDWSTGKSNSIAGVVSNVNSNSSPTKHNPNLTNSAYQPPHTFVSHILPIATPANSYAFILPNAIFWQPTFKDDNVGSRDI